MPTSRIFQAYKHHVLDADNVAKHRIFIDRSAPVLFVAHVDTIHEPRINRITKEKIFGCGLDDRLGCLIASSLSAELRADLLLTDHEEVCNSTAQYHVCKPYNWVAEFDRDGTDAVTYSLDSDLWLKALSDYWRIGIGSFSDIALLDTSACCVNIGIGSHDAHSRNSSATIAETRSQIQRFRAFYTKHKNTVFVRNPEPAYDYSDRFGFTSDALELCDNCGTRTARQLYGYCLCESCFTEIVNNYYFFDRDLLDRHSETLKCSH